MADFLIEGKLIKGSADPLFDGLDGINILNSITSDALANTITVTGKDADGNTITRTVSTSGLTESQVDDRIATLVSPWALAASGALIPAGKLPSASSTAKGAIQLATNSSAQTGTDALTAVTPASLSHVLDDRTATTSRTGTIELATSTEATDATDNEKAMTPALVKQVVDAAGAGFSEAEIKAFFSTWVQVGNADPIPLSKLPDATELSQGIIEIATSAEVTDATNDTRAITPLKLKEALDAAAPTNVNALITAAVEPWALLANSSTKIPTVQLDDATENVKGVAELATTAEADAGTDDTKIMTPSLVKRRIEAVTVSSSGLNQLQADGRVMAGVFSWALRGNSDDVPEEKLPDGTATAKGILELADSSEADAGTNTSKAMTPALVKRRIDAIPDPDNVASWAEAGNNDDIPPGKLPCLLYTSPSPRD